MERILLFRNGSTEISRDGPLCDGEVMYLFICDPFNEEWLGSSIFQVNHVDYKRSCMAWYDARWGDPTASPRRVSLAIYVFTKGGALNNTPQQVAVEKRFMISDRTVWFSTIHEAFLHFREEYNRQEDGEACTEAISDRLIRLWSLNQNSDWSSFRRGGILSSKKVTEMSFGETDEAYNEIV